MSLLPPSATDKILEIINLCDQRVLNTVETVKYHIYIYIYDKEHNMAAKTRKLNIYI